MIDDTQIQYLERLARIRLEPAQRDAFRDEIGRVLAYMERLAAIDDDPAAAGVATNAQEPDMDGAVAGKMDASAPAEDAADERPAGFGLASCRPDTVQPSLPRGELLAMGPQATEAYLTVPLAVT